MKTNVNRFSDELAYQILQEYLTTDISQVELKKKYNYKEEEEEETLLQLIKKDRTLMPKLGVRNLLGKLEPRLPPEQSLGRDKFFDFLRKHRLLVGKKHV